VKNAVVACLVVAALSGACGTDEASDRPAADGEQPVAAPSPAVCLQGGPFVADGSIPVPTAESADARRIGALRWEPHEGCERFVIDLLDEAGTPAARAGNVTAEVLRGAGVVRVSMRDVTTVDTDATDAAVGGPLVRAGYAVWSPDGRWTWVDLHLAAAAEAHVSTLDEPARVVVDLRPGGPPLPDPAATGTRVVVLQPRPGAADYPLTVTGYARTFEANVVARLRQDGGDVAEQFTTATAWVDAWGHYSITFADGPAGPLELHVGEYSARDGSWEGVAIDLDMRR
jgi:hypothetical protein